MLISWNSRLKYCKYCDATNNQEHFFLQTKMEFHYQVNNLALFQKAIANPVREMPKITVIRRSTPPTELLS